MMRILLKIFFIYLIFQSAFGKDYRPSKIENIWKDADRNISSLDKNKNKKNPLKNKTSQVKKKNIEINFQRIIKDKNFK